MNKPALKPNAFSTASTGLDALFGDGGNPNEFPVLIDIDDIEVKSQPREVFETPEQTLADLGKSLRINQIQEIVVRPNRPDAPRPYLLVAGERRVRAAKLEGLPKLRAYVRDLTDDQAGVLQAAENIHRLNFSQIEEAKFIKEEIARLGGVDAVLAKHHKSRPWLSKLMGLLDLPEQAKRLVTEGISADIEVIGAVRTIAKIDPVKAKTLVDDLKFSQGKPGTSARDRVAAVKHEVKPGKKPLAKTMEVLKAQREKDSALKASGAIVATEKDRSVQQPSAGTVFSAMHGGGFGGPGQATPTSGRVGKGPTTPAEIMGRAYTAIFDGNSDPKGEIDAMTDSDREAIESQLLVFYEAGKQATDLGKAIIQGFRKGQFATDSDGAFSLVAFLHGSDSNAKFNLLNIFASVKE